MEWWHLVVLVFVGIGVGFINVISGGGSIITLPILILFGLDSTVANASNRIGNLAQNIFAVAGYKSKGIVYEKYAWFLGISAGLGGVIGTYMALKIPDNAFNKILAIVMLVVVVFTVFSPKIKVEAVIGRMQKKHQLLGVIVFFFIGIYGGFIQAGTGLIIMAALAGIHHFTYLKINTYKVLVVLFYLVIGLSIFAFHGQINWYYGLSLGLGNAIGGWLTSRWSINQDDVWIKRFMVASVLVLAIKLLFF